MFKKQLFSRIVHTSRKSRNFQESHTLLGKVGIFKNLTHFSAQVCFSRVVRTCLQKSQITNCSNLPEFNCYGLQHKGCRITSTIKMSYRALATRRIHEKHILRCLTGSRRPKIGRKSSERTLRNAESSPRVFPHKAP